MLGVAREMVLIYYCTSLSAFKYELALTAAALFVRDLRQRALKLPSRAVGVCGSTRGVLAGD